MRITNLIYKKWRTHIFLKKMTKYWTDFWKSINAGLSNHIENILQDPDSILWRFCPIKFFHPLNEKGVLWQNVDGTKLLLPSGIKSPLSTTSKRKMVWSRRMRAVTDQKTKSCLTDYEKNQIAINTTYGLNFGWLHT